MKSQRGLTLIEIGIFLVILAAIGGAGVAIVHTYKSAIERAQTAEADAKVKGLALSDQLVENTRLRTAAEATDRINAERKSNDGKKADIERMVKNAVQSVYAKSPESRKWADTAVPGDVLGSVRGEPAGGGSVGSNNPRAVAGAVDGRDAGTGHPGGNDQRRPARLHTTDAIPLGDLQRRQGRPGEVVRGAPPDR